MTLADQQRALLLALARQAVTVEVTGSGAVQPFTTDAELAQRRGCFVTLTNRGRLRGCIGTFHPVKPLAAQVIEMAVAACQDPRFVQDPITPGELGRLNVHISVLSELTPIANPLDIELGVHGIYIVRGHSAGCFLPEVATETGWSKEEFLSQCCAGKAGMSPDAWRQDGTQVLVFTSERFGEAEG
jgi:AmmeMemoRadiSam system protein A